LGIVSAASCVASWACLVATVAVTIRYRLPLERATEPTLGSTTTTVSGESMTGSGSAITPSFIWSRTAMQVSCGSAVAGWSRWAAQDGGRLDPGTNHARPDNGRQDARAIRAGARGRQR